MSLIQPLSVCSRGGMYGGENQEIGAHGERCRTEGGAGEACLVDRSIGTENRGAAFWKSWLAAQEAQVLPVWRRSDVIA